MWTSFYVKLSQQQGIYNLKKIYPVPLLLEEKRDQVLPSFDHNSSAQILHQFELMLAGRG